MGFLAVCETSSFFAITPPVHAHALNEPVQCIYPTAYSVHSDPPSVDIRLPVALEGTIPLRELPPLLQRATMVYPMKDACVKSYSTLSLTFASKRIFGTAHCESVGSAHQLCAVINTVPHMNAYHMRCRRGVSCNTRNHSAGIPKRSHHTLMGGNAKAVPTALISSLHSG